jgi:polyphosphate kinase
VETLCPVRDPALRDHLRTVVIEAYLRDNERAWTLDAAGVYHPAAVDGAPFAAQQTLLEHYLRRD